MILSKANLLINNITKKEGDTRLDNLHIAKDGSTVSANTRTIMACSPVKKKVKEDLKFLEGGELNDSQTLTSETIKSVLKYLPKDSLYGGLLEHADYQNGKFTINDGKRKQVVVTKAFERKYIDYRKAFLKVGESKFDNHIAINIKTLLNTLNAIDKAVQNTTSEQPLFISITEEGNLLLRSQNYKTGQRVVAVTTAYKKRETKWLKWDIWEMRLFGMLRKLKK